MQTTAGSEMLKEVVSEFKLFWKEVTTSFVMLSAENVELKGHLQEVLHLLRMFTTGQMHSWNTDLVSSPQDGVECTAGDDEVRDEVLVEEEFAGIHAYSQSKCVTPSPMT